MKTLISFGGSGRFNSVKPFFFQEKKNMDIHRGSFTFSNAARTLDILTIRQGYFRSVCASAHPDQNLHCLFSVFHKGKVIVPVIILNRHTS